MAVLSLNGTVVINGVTYQITRIRLREGQLKITAVHNGPVQPFQGMAAVFGEDGQGICQSWAVDIPEHAAYGDRVEVVLPIRIATLEIKPG